MMSTVRKTLCLFLACLFVVIQIFGLSSCSKKNNGDNNSDSANSEDNENNNTSSDSNNSNSNNSANEKYIVRFLTDDGIPISIVECKKGDSLTLPKAPQKIGSIFSGWSGNYSNITQNTDVFAKYTDISQKENVLSADTVYVNDKSEFNVLVGIYGNVNFCGLDLDIEYDSDILELLEVTDVDDCVIANNGNDGVINMNYVTTDNTTGDVTFMNLKFRSKVETKTETSLLISVNSMYSLVNDVLTKSNCQVLQNKIIIEEAQNEKQ